MRNTTLIVLIVLAAGMLTWAVLQSYYARQEPAPPVQTNLLQGLSISGLRRIVLKQGGETLTLDRTEQGGFTVADKDGYPAAPAKVFDLVTKCTDIRTAELATRSAEHHKDLEVTEEAARTVVKFFGADDKLITGLAIGKDAPGGKYVRLLTADEVYVATDVPTLETAPLKYVDKVLLDIKQEDIERITVEGPDGAFSLKLQAEAPKVSLVEEVPAGKKLRTYDAEWIARRLEDLEFDDVKQAGEVFSFAKASHRIVCRLKDKRVPQDGRRPVVRRLHGGVSRDAADGDARGGAGGLAEAEGRGPEGGGGSGGVRAAARRLGLRDSRLQGGGHGQGPQ